MSKTSWLILSVALNVILAGFFLQRFINRDASLPPATPPRVAQTSANRHDSLPAADVGRMNSRGDRVETTVSAPPPVVRSNSLANAALPDLVRRLRAAGFSDVMVADFVSAQMNRQMEDERQELERRIRRGETDPRERIRFQAAWWANRRSVLESALGPEAYVAWDKENVLRQFDLTGLSLTSDQENQLYELAKARQDVNQALNWANNLGQIDPTEYREQEKTGRKDYDQALEQLLGTARAQQIKQDNDWSFGRTRWDLRNASLSDAQFDALFTALQQNNEKQQELRQLSRAGEPIDGSKWRELSEERERSIQQAIGDAGFEMYKKTQDHRYSQMQQYATAWQLSDDQIDRVYQMIQDATQAVKDFRNQAQADAKAGSKIDWSAINQGVEDHKAQVESDLRRYLGDERFEKMKRAGVLRIDR